MDALEAMENMLPSYSYADIDKMTDTDRKVRDVLVSDLMEIKEQMFHVVQVSYELRRDNLSQAAEPIWDEMSSLLARVRASRLCEHKDSKGCKLCMEGVERNILKVVIKDKELVSSVKSIKAASRMLYRSLMEKGMEKYFIRNLDKIKTGVEEINTLLEERASLVKVVK